MLDVPNATCTNCNHQIVLNVPPTRGPAGAGYRNQGWLCNMCSTQICIHCYINHTGDEQPEAYKPDYFNKQKSKKQKK